MSTTYKQDTASFSLYVFVSVYRCAKINFYSYFVFLLYTNNNILSLIFAQLPLQKYLAYIQSLIYTHTTIITVLRVSLTLSHYLFLILSPRNRVAKKTSVNLDQIYNENVL